MLPGGEGGGGSGRVIQTHLPQPSEISCINGVPPLSQEQVVGHVGLWLKQSHL